MRWPSASEQTRVRLPVLWLVLRQVLRQVLQLVCLLVLLGLLWATS